MSGEIIAELKNITKTFGNVVAIKDLSLSFLKGEIRGLLGENGAGKSTLMNILYGLYRPDKGEIYINGNLVRINSPYNSIKLGIGMVHQTSTLVPEFTAVENIILGIEYNKLKFSENLSKEIDKIKHLSKELGLVFPLNTKVKELSAGEKQKIEIIRALYRNVKLLILDEPTTSLVESEFHQLLTSLKELTKKDVSIIFITHKIKEVIEACDSVTVLRKGENQGTLSKKELTKERLVKLMFIEKEIQVNESALPQVKIEPTKLTEKPICIFNKVFIEGSEKSTGLKDISFEIYGGEIFGVASISGNGEKDLANCLINPSQVSRGEIIINDEKITNKAHSKKIFAQGMFYTPEDRIKEGVLLDASLVENVLLGHHNKSYFLKHKLLIDWKKAFDKTGRIIQEFNVDTPSEDIAIRKLSGGNIQKVVIGRALAFPINFLVTHNPTSGLDISTVEFIFKKLVEIRNNSGAVLWINEDLDELMIASDKIAVLYKGEIKAILKRNEFDKYKIGLLMIGEA
jgi:ABC-type uncharacterized transport system ATPase subunit